jgi:hypothetical protein
MDTIKLIVAQQEEQLEIRGALPLPNFGKSGNDIVEVNIAKIKDEIQSSLSSVLNLIANVKIDTPGARLKEMKFSIGITEAGEVGLFSVLKGSVSGTTSIDFLIEFEK